MYGEYREKKSVLKVVDCDMLEATNKLACMRLAQSPINRWHCVRSMCVVCLKATQRDVMAPCYGEAQNKKKTLFCVICFLVRSLCMLRSKLDLLPVLRCAIRILALYRIVHVFVCKQHKWC